LIRRTIEMVKDRKERIDRHIQKKVKNELFKRVDKKEQWELRKQRIERIGEEQDNDIDIQPITSEDTV
jgi:hypothetical protein